MKYQEKINFVDKALELMKEGNSKKDVENYLKGEGLEIWNIKKINQAIDNHLKFKYKPKLKSYMLNNSLESKISEFDELDADVFEKFQYEIIDELIFSSRKEIKSMIANGKSAEEIVEKTSNQFFDEEAVYDEIELENNKINKIRNQKNKGIGLIILGVILSIISADLIQNGVVVFYGLVIYGFILLFKKY